MANAQPDLDAGDETRHTGDRLGFPHPVSDGTSLSNVSNLEEGVLVTFDGTDIAESTRATDDIVGVLFTLPVYGETTHGGPYVRGDKQATVAVRGSYVADLSDFSPTVGTYLDDNGDVFVKAQVDGDKYEVILR
jgi:hypothetical protein